MLSVFLNRSNNGHPACLRGLMITKNSGTTNTLNNKTAVVMSLVAIKMTVAAMVYRMKA